MFYVSPSDEAPIYRQLIRRVVEAIASGRLVAGAQLPSHRELARTLVIAPLTVKKAYDMLESDGYIASRQGLGTFVAQSLPVSHDASAETTFTDDLHRLVRTAQAIGLTPDALVARIVDAYREADPRRSADPPRDAAPPSDLEAYLVTGPQPVADPVSDTDDPQGRPP